MTGEHIPFELAVFGWAVARGLGSYPSPRARFKAEREVADLEGVPQPALYDRTQADLDSWSPPLPAWSALAGTAAWHGAVV